MAVPHEGPYFASRAIGWFVSITFALALLIVVSVAALLPPSPPAARLASAHVLVQLEASHGSATHIGGGLYVTAAHVVGDNAEVQIRGAAAPVLWSNKDYDIALVAGPAEAASVPLWCGTAAVGEIGQAHGNPMSLEDIVTTLTVAGVPREIADWKLALPMDGAVGPGMSGGGWIVDGRLAGVNVGAAMAPTSAGLPSYYGVSVVVPSSVVCQLLGRV